MILLDCCLSTGVVTKNGAAEPAAVGKTDVSGVGGTTVGFSPPPGGGVAIAERESRSTVRNSHALLLRRRRQSVLKVSTINSLSTFVISEMLNGRVTATLMVLVVVEVGLLRAQARWVPYRHWGFSVRGTSLDTRASAHYVTVLSFWCGAPAGSVARP